MIVKVPRDAEITTPPISDPDSLALWLKEKPPEWASLIATRIALRVAPILRDALCADEESRRAQIVLPSLIALAAVSTSSAQFDRTQDVRQAVRTAARGATDAMAEIYSESQMNVIHSIEAVPEEHLYIHELEADRDAVRVAAYAVDAIVHAVQTTSELFDVVAGLASFDAILDSVTSTAKEAHWAVDGANGYKEFYSAVECDSEEEIEPLHISEFWRAVQRDAAYLEAGANDANEAATSGNLSEYRLWPDGIPIWASRRWAKFKDAMPPEERWDKWIDWYDACLLGKFSICELAMKAITVAGKEWLEGPAKTNATTENLNDGDEHSNNGTTNVPENLNYQVALSFAGEQREYVEEVARHLQARSIAVFYDEFESAQLWGKDAVEAFHEVYSTRAKYVVMFISSDYVTKFWPRHERRSALSRMLKEERDNILPVRFDDTLVPGLPDTMLYLEANEYSPAELSAVIANKIGIPAFDGKASDVPPPRMASPLGEAKFDYSSYNGRYIIGSGVAEFETKWSKASNTSIHIYNDPTSIHGVAIDRDASAIHEITKASSLDYTSRVQTPTTGQVVVLRNQNGLYAAVQILKIKDNTRGDNSDELHFRYAIQGNGTDSFEFFRESLE